MSKLRLFRAQVRQVGERKKLSFFTRAEIRMENRFSLRNIIAGKKKHEMRLVMCEATAGSRECHSNEVSAFCNAHRLVMGVFLLFLSCVCFSARVEAAQADRRLDLSVSAVRSAYVRQLAERSWAAKTEVETWARLRRIPVRHDDGVHVFELMYLRGNRPVYYMTYNADAAISTATDMVRDTASYNLSGSGLTIGVWDSSGVRATHQEFETELGSRVSIMDGAPPFSDHSTHVAGTIGASGINPAALGMAPAVDIHSYDWNADTSEMAWRGATSADEADKIHVSNHSYGPASGWVYTDWSDSWGWHWSPFVDWNGVDSIEDLFGQYDSTVREFDEIAYNAPYYLIVSACGNDRNDNPAIGETVYFTLDGASWMSIPYSTSTCPAGDGVIENKNGYDTISGHALAKNVMAVGSVTDAVFDGVRHLPRATMSVFSSWGPADDGRVKPDVVANGNALYSPIAAGDDVYDVSSGTSMASPNASGSAVLLVEYYGRLFPGQAMRSSTLKGLIIHTADDLGDMGPDYSFGWGLMNSEAAAAVIAQHHDDPSANVIAEPVLGTPDSAYSYSFNADGVSPIRATLCWTDPPAAAIKDHDVNSPRLVNDLDLRIIGPGGSPIYYPYVLDPANPSAAATTGDNALDNVEQIFIAEPLVEGAYTAEVSHKGVLANGEQHFSLIVSQRLPLVIEYQSNDTPMDIPDDDKIISSLDIGNARAIVDLNVKLNISHTHDNDLSVFLVGPEPDRIMVELFTNVGGSGDDFTDTTLDDEASLPITEGSAPFTGFYRPEGSLSEFYGRSIAGTWTLAVVDDPGGDAGTLNWWSLIVEFAGVAGN
jgi:subtilisin-like proprotein convertase family protein